MSGLVVEGVRVRAGGRAVVAGASFTGPAGAVTGLIGPNGAGKSTLLAAVLGLRQITGGSVRFGDIDLLAMRVAERARLCSYVEQSSDTVERLTVRDVVALGRLPFQSAWQSEPGARDGELVEAALAALDLAALAERLYPTLSGGEQQRAQVARALAQEPRLLLLDEPTSHLDIAAQLSTLELLRQRSRAGCTVVLAIHDLNLAARFCDHLVVMHAGRVVAEGAPAEVLTPELLLDVYGVHATVMRSPDGALPAIFYDRARGAERHAKAD